PGYNSKISYDLTNQMTLIVWTNLTVAVDDQLTQPANTLWVKVLDHIYKVSPLQPPPSPTATRSSVFRTMPPCTVAEVKKMWSRATVGNRVFNCLSLE